MKSFALLPKMLESSSSSAVNIFSNEPNFSNSAFAFVPPTFGKPSRMNCFCCFSSLRIFDALMPDSGFSVFLART